MKTIQLQQNFKTEQNKIQTLLGENKVLNKKKKLKSFSTLQKIVKNITDQLRIINENTPYMMDYCSSEEEQEPPLHISNRFTIDFDCRSKTNILFNRSQPISPNKLTIKLPGSKKKASIKLQNPFERYSMPCQPRQNSKSQLKKPFNILNDKKTFNIKRVYKTDKSFKSASKKQPSKEQVFDKKAKSLTRPKIQSKKIAFRYRKEKAQNKQNFKSTYKSRESLIRKLRKIDEECYRLQSKRTSIKNTIKRFAKYREEIDSQLTKKVINFHKIKYQ